MALSYTKAEPITLRGHPDFNEAWLQDRIALDTGILGLGEVELVGRERRQDKAGRLDLLLYDRRENTRYEVELMLGATDESHIIRCLEYWDIERRRFPAYDHCAVIVAENITSRFLNILSLFAGTIPLVAIQLNALKVGEQIVLNFVTVLDRVALRHDDEAETAGPAVDRDDWNQWASPATVAIADKILQRVNGKTKTPQQLNFLKVYIGLTDGTKSDNFIYFIPRKRYTYMYARVSDAQKYAAELQAKGLEASVDKYYGSLCVLLRPEDLNDADWLNGVVADAVSTYEQE
jgi:hypothetical protein